MAEKVKFLTGTGLSEPKGLTQRGGLHARLMAETLMTPDGLEAASRFYEVQVARLKRVSAELGVKLRSDEDELTELANFIRSANAHLAALKGNLEACRLSQGWGPAFADCAGISMGFLYSMLQAIESEHNIGFEQAA